MKEEDIRRRTNLRERRKSAFKAEARNVRESRHSKPAISREMGIILVSVVLTFAMSGILFYVVLT